MKIGMTLHRLAPPRPPHPSFTRTVKAKVSPREGEFDLVFYVPSDYKPQQNLHGRKYPVIINFHGGGFTIGTATDDARWCKTAVEEVGAVVCSVDYRLAPEYPFPTAIEDGVDAILYLVEHAAELNLDLDRVAISGFSCGGNMCFTVPLRLQEEFLEGIAKPGPSTSQEALAVAQKPQLQRAMSKGRMLAKVQKQITIRAIVAWYPSCDYTRTREQRRATCSRRDQELPAVFTELFDDSYLQPPTMDMGNPYLSPGVAPDFMLHGLPDDIIIFCCEWDMLLAEGEALKDRLQNEIHKNVWYHMVPGVPHGWDKAPNPMKWTPGVHGHYKSACNELKRIFRQRHLSTVQSVAVPEE